jgi:hypothetical protein
MGHFIAVQCSFYVTKDLSDLWKSCFSDSKGTCDHEFCRNALQLYIIFWDHGNEST